uniref:hypothetical protein n=1 Tax=Algoriphagus sp. TaxID=1872435 RepID=UPI002591226E
SSKTARNLLGQAIGFGGLYPKRQPLGSGVSRSSKFASWIIILGSQSHIIGLKPQDFLHILGNGLKPNS